MTCGNPICRYEFCWLCMKEAVPNHFDYGPCAGKQFFDPDSSQSGLQSTNPRLNCIYYFYHYTIILIFLIIIGFLLVPALGFSFLAYQEIIVNDNLDDYLHKKFLKYILLMDCFFIFLSIQSIAYMLWGLALSILAIIIAAILIDIVYIILEAILKPIICPKKRKVEVIDVNIKEEEIELGDNINKENNENNENKENEENNNNKIN